MIKCLEIVKYYKPLLILCLIFVTQVSRGQSISNQKRALIKNKGIVEYEWQKKKNFEIRRSSIELNPVNLSLRTLNLGDTLEINLFDEESYKVKVNRKFLDINGIFSISGRIEGVEQGYFYLSSKNGITLVDIELIQEGRKYLISYDKSNNVHRMTEIDVSKIDNFRCASPLTIH